MYMHVCTGAMHDKELLEQLVWNLRTWPLELIEWQTQNSHRTDIIPHPELARYVRPHMLCGM